MKLHAKHYYSSALATQNTGDIYRGLPTFGLLKMDVCSGIVITPACDLSNSKVETITYLPIISIKNWFCSRSIYQIIRSELKSHFNNVPIEFDETILPKNFLPKVDSLPLMKSLIPTDKSVSQKHKEIYGKILNGIGLIEKIISPEEQKFEGNDLLKFIGEKKLNQIKEKIISNSFSNDIHFLPKDYENIEWSAIENHSLALFRYPITVPIEIFELANDYNCSNWELSVDELSQRLPSVDAFKNMRPLKSIRLNQEFLGDLLTRFVSLYVRLGSPDFTPDVMEKIKTEI